MAIKFSNIPTILLLACFCINVILCAPKCDRMPEGTGVTKSPPDGRFRLRISTDPQYYIPGETYNITLEGVTRFASPMTQKFSAFFITSESISDSDLRWESNGYDDAGRFAIIQPATSKISEKCPNLIVNTNSVSKSEVTVQWTAPSSSGRGCIVIRSTVIEHRDVWFMDDGALSKTLCEDEADASEIEQFIINECKACAEAKYELTFEGLWSRNTHPKDFPDDGWLTKFSDIIGASHTVGDPFWRYGDTASPGMKDVAEHGATQRLEDELKQKGENVRTIIKARGISYPNVNGKTFAVFRVDAQHHLISLVSKIYPSPDWFVGIHDFELCTPTGQWIEHKEIKLYPYDSGVDSGPTYTSADQPTYPAEAIRRIRPNNPNDPRSPFYDPENKEMKPLAKLYITRQRLYEKTCDDENENGHEDSRNGEGDEEEEYNGNSCATTEWGSWSDCNNLCGDGRKTRKRFYVSPEKAYKSGCQEKLEDHRDCVGKNCPSRGSNRDDNRESVRESINNQRGGGSAEVQNNDLDDEDEVPSSDTTCEMTEWSDEGCTCENGQKREHRTFKNARNLKACKRRYQNVKFERVVNCGNTDCPVSGRDDTTRRTAASCQLSKWSKWSKCSSHCFGQSIRVRRPEQRHLLYEENLKRVAEVYTKIQNRNEDEEDILSLNFTSVQNPDHDCAGEKLVESKRCNKENDEECLEMETDGPPKFCLHPPMRGNCNKDPEILYFFNKHTNDCGQFMYTGCDGSKNSFDTYKLCRETCVVSGDGDDDIEAEPQSLDLVSKQRRERIDCELTQWKFTACNASCGESYRWKYRDVVKRPQNGGRVCPIKLRQLERCHVMECEPKSSSNNDYTINRYNLVTRSTTMPTSQAIRCEYSEWSAWSPCSKSCGSSAIKIRTRTVLNYQNSQQHCNDRLEEKECEVLPCLAGYHNYRNHHPYY